MIHRAVPHSSTTRSKPFWKNVMDKLKAIASPLDEIYLKTETVQRVADRLSQADFNDGVKELCEEFNIPQSLVTALMIQNVANIVNKSEGNDTKYHTLKELSQCLRYGDGNWMQFIPAYKRDANIYMDRIDLGLIRAFYSFAVSQGLDPIDAFNVTKARMASVEKFLDYANTEAHKLTGMVISTWFVYSDLYTYAGRKILEVPAPVTKFEIQYELRKGMQLS